MILQWRSVSLDEFQAEWQGRLCCLVREQPQQRWRLYVVTTERGAVFEVINAPELRVRGEWLTARKAMEVVDVAVTKIVRDRSSRSLSGVMIGKPLFNQFGGSHVTA